LKRKKRDFASEMTSFQFKWSPKALNRSNRQIRSMDRSFRRDLAGMANLESSCVEAWRSVQGRKCERASMAENWPESGRRGRAAAAHLHFRALSGNPGRKGSDQYRHRESRRGAKMKSESRTDKREAFTCLHSHNSVKLPNVTRGDPDGPAFDGEPTVITKAPASPDVTIAATTARGIVKQDLAADGNLSALRMWELTASRSFSISGRFYFASRMTFRHSIFDTDEPSNGQRAINGQGTSNCLSSDKRSLVSETVASCHKRSL
jgi:hypothetical protein